ncbi:hypothetical protein PFISCL1PPCAC_4049, partial [Pristionchus fissidentatus]
MVRYPVRGHFRGDSPRLLDVGRSVESDEIPSRGRIELGIRSDHCDYVLSVLRWNVLRQRVALLNPVHNLHE